MKRLPVRESVAPEQKSPPPTLAAQPVADVPERDFSRGDSSRGVTPRVVVVSLVVAALLAYVISVADYKFSNTFLGATHLPPGAIAALLVLLLVVNPLLRLGAARLAFSRNEVLTVYLSCLFSTLVPGIGGNNYFVSFIIGSFYYATNENHWFDTLKGLPPWFTPALNADGTQNRYVVDAWYTGLAHGQSIPWGAWLVPLLAWGLFMLASFSMMGCLSVMLRAQWGHNEALAFPLLRLPLELTEGIDATENQGFGPFFRNPLMWAGFGIAALVQLVNGLNLYFPDVPAIPLYLDTGPLFTEAPWNQIGGATVIVYPIAVGIAYVMTSEVSFSCWFFFWLIKFQLIGAYLLGYPPNSLPTAGGMANGGKVFTGFQEMGAYLGYFAIIFWTARAHLKHIALRALGRAQAQAAEGNEGLSYPAAFWGFLVSFAIMFAWGVCAGMHPILSLALWVYYLITAVILARVIAEGGLVFVHHLWLPIGAWSALGGIGPNTFLSTSNGLVPATFMQFAVLQDFRATLMPSFVQAFKLAYDRRIAGRALFALIFAVILVGMLIGFTMNVRLGYENGGLGLQGWLSKWGPQGVGSQVAAFASASESVDFVAWAAMIGGAVLTVAVMAIRARVSWFPLHPIGYILAQTYAMQSLWFSLFLGWASKTLVTRFGGTDTYRKTVPLFLGLSLGDVSMMLFWLVIDGWQGRTGHQLMPG